jgi:MFS superfamily sulfate permease-like transporter
MFISILSSKKYWISVCFIGIGFIIIYSGIEYFMQYGSATWDIFIEEKIHNQQWVRYLLSRIVGGLAYGMIMGYYFELRKRKSNR